MLQTTINNWQSTVNNWQSLAGTASSPLPMQMASCDPAIEACDASGDVLERPTRGAFGTTTLLLPIAESFMLFMTPFAGFLFGSASLEAFLFILPAIFVSAAFSWPFVISLFYLLFGADFVIFSWIDNFLSIVIEHYFSNVMILLFMIILFFSFAANFVAKLISSSGLTSGYGSYHYSVAFMQISIHLWVWNKMMYSSVNAIRYVNPSWNKVSDGKRLLPSIAYLFTGYESTESQELSQKKLTASLTDEVQEQVWSLLVEM